MNKKHGVFQAIPWSGMAGIAVILLAAMFIFTGCPTEGKDDGPTTVTYTGKTADGTTYMLTITDDTSYVLTVVGTDGTKKTSSGSAAKSGGTYTLTPAVPSSTSGQTGTFDVNVSSDGITDMDGTITFDDGTDQEAPEEDVTPTGSTGGGGGGSDNPFKGTWTGQTTIPSGGDDNGTVAATVTVVVSDTTFESTTAGVNGVITVKQKGTYTYTSTTMTGTVTAVDYLYNGVSAGWSTDPQQIEFFGGAAFSGTLSNGKLTNSGGIEFTKR